MECDGRIAWDKGGIRDDLGVSPMPCVLADAISGESLRRNRLVKMKEARAETLHEGHMLIMESADVREEPESAGECRCEQRGWRTLSLQSEAHSHHTTPRKTSFLAGSPCCRQHLSCLPFQVQSPPLS